VRQEDGRPAWQHPGKGVVQKRLGVVVQGHQGLLNDEQSRVAQDGPGQGDAELLAGPQGMAQFADGIGEALVSRFVHLNPVPSYCALSGLARPDKLRWRKGFTQAEVDEICAPLGVGPVRALAVEGRGVSGRARALRIEGAKATTRVYGELSIRRLFRNLNSGMFVIEKSGDWVFTGGGWGHGSGMCQTGAIGRAELGDSYARILGWYYSGAAPVRIY